MIYDIVGLVKSKTTSMLKTEGKKSARNDRWMRKSEYIPPLKILAWDPFIQIYNYASPKSINNKSLFSGVRFDLFKENLCCVSTYCTSMPEEFYPHKLIFAS